jgi:hypothetical protein
MPTETDVGRLAALLNGDGRMTILCGWGCESAHDQVPSLADRLKAPIVHTLAGEVESAEDEILVARPAAPSTACAPRSSQTSTTADKLERHRPAPDSRAHRRTVRRRRSSPRNQRGPGRSRKSYAVSRQHAPIKQAVASNGVGLTFVDCRRLRRIGHGAIPYGFAAYIRARCRMDAARPTPT